MSCNFVLADSADLDLASPPHLDNMEPLLWGAWIYPRSIGQGNMRIIQKDNNFNAGALRLQMNNSLGLRMFKDYSTTDHDFISAASSITLNSWNFIAMYWNGSNDLGSVKFWVNMSSPGFQSRQTGVGTKNSDASIEFHIGNTDADSNSFDGYISDVFCYGSLNVQSYDYIMTLLSQHYMRYMPLQITPEGTPFNGSILRLYLPMDDMNDGQAIATPNTFKDRSPFYTAVSGKFATGGASTTASNFDALSYP